MTATSQLQPPERKVKKLIRKKTSGSPVPKRKKLIKRKKSEDKPKVKKLVKKTSTPTPVKPPSEENTPKKTEPCKQTVQNKNSYDSCSEDDIEYVFTVNWVCQNKTFLLDQLTGEVYSKKDHSLVGKRFVNDDELSDIDYDYSDGD